MFYFEYLPSNCFGIWSKSQNYSTKSAAKCGMIRFAKQNPDYGVREIK